jgi:hypothetical protein
MDLNMTIKRVITPINVLVETSNNDTYSVDHKYVQQIFELLNKLVETVRAKHSGVFGYVPINTIPLGTFKTVISNQVRTYAGKPVRTINQFNDNTPIHVTIDGKIYVIVLLGKKITMIPYDEIY